MQELSEPPAATAAAERTDIAALRAAYRAGTLSPLGLVETLLARIEARGADHVWITAPDPVALRTAARALEAAGPEGKALWGIPFAIKDNIDLAGVPTTAACPAFAYVPRASAPAVQRLVEAGAIPIGKTNLDQFATGLNGTRSPYGTPRSPINADYIPGGSSSGSAVAVATGLASFALGTDTAGSGRVPAAFNNLVGLKPTRGSISALGVVPACRSLDCVSILALTAADALLVFEIASGFDAADPYSRRPDSAAAATAPRTLAGCRLGVPRSDQLEFFGNKSGELRFAATLGLAERLGAKLVEIDFAPFLEVARLLYEGPWIAERFVAIRDFFGHHPEALHPVTRQVIAAGQTPSAADAFTALYRLQGLRRAIEPFWEGIDAIITPTAGRQYTVEELLADPLHLNSALGYYTNFVNLLDLSAIAVPAGLQEDGLAFGITLIAPAWHDAQLAALGDTLHRAGNETVGAIGLELAATPPLATKPTSETVRLAVCGAHMAGLALNGELAERGARLVRTCRTAPGYRLYALPGSAPAGSLPARPGLVRREPGRPIEVEVWELPLAQFGGFVAGIPAPLGIGSVALEDGETVKGFLCEAYAVANAEDITNLGGWRRYLERRRG
ncbi:MAG: allophanate hydrolase [Acetobacteraceae bacterium]